MGYDRIGLPKSKSGRKAPSGTNPYVLLLTKLYRFLSRRTHSKFNATVLKRLVSPRVSRPPLSLSRLVRYMSGKENSRVAVVVGTVTDDLRLSPVNGKEMPAFKVAALRFSEKARARIVANGGQCLTLDQLALVAPRGKDCVLLRGKVNSRETVKHWGAPGVPGSHAKPYVNKGNLRGRKHERARGRRASKAFKVKK